MSTPFLAAFILPLGHVAFPVSLDYQAGLALKSKNSPIIFVAHFSFQAGNIFSDLYSFTT